MSVFKKTIFLLLVAPLVWSCSSDDDNLPDDPKPEQTLAGDWNLSALNFEGSTEQEAMGEIVFKGDEEELNAEDVFALKDDGTYQAGTAPMALNVEVSMGDTVLHNEDLKGLGIDTDSITPFLTFGTWVANDDNTEIVFTEDESEETSTFNVEEFDGDHLKITTNDGYSLVKTAGIIPANLVDVVGPIDVAVTMEFDKK